MRELDAIISAYNQAQKEDTDCILATVVHVQGSAYRKAGARMLIDEFGNMTGAISGGCLEGDALRKALHALHQQKNKLVTYDTSDEEDAVIGAQLGCNGIIQVLFEPIDNNNLQNPIELLKILSSSDKPLVIVSFFDLDKTRPQKGTVMLSDEELHFTGPNLEQSYLDQLKSDIQQCFRAQQGQHLQYNFGNRSQHVFLELYNPPPHLVLVGAGNDAQVLSQLAIMLGWKVTVTDGRPTHANINRFLNSCQVMVTKPEKVLDNIILNNQTYFVLMSHNYKYDLEVLKLLIQLKKVPYIGLLGPRSKSERMLEDLKKEDISLTKDQLSKLYTPVGLDIGAETPAEIALAILAEIQSVITQTRAQSLRDKNGPIHDKKQPDFKVVDL